MKEQNKSICSQAIENSIQQVKTFINSTKNITKIFNEDPISTSKKKKMNMLLASVNEMKKHADDYINQLLSVQEQYIPCHAPGKSGKKQETSNRKRSFQELSSDDESSLYEPSLSPPRKDIKIKSKKQKKPNEAKEAKVAKKRKGKYSNFRGRYTTVCPELRPFLFQILHEQAQIWYDLHFNDQIDLGLRKIRESQLITNEKVKDKPLTEITVFNKIQSLLFDDKPQEVVEKQSDIFHSPVKYQDPDTFFKSYDDMETYTCSQNSFERIDVDDFSIESVFKHFDEMIGRVSFGGNKTRTKEILIKMEDEESELGTELKKYNNMIVNIPLKPLHIPLTIPEQDIFKYLKDNDSTVIAENKMTDSETQISIFKKISKLTQISEKTLQRFTINGRERKKGGGRKSLDSPMEKELTKYVIELSKRGRPPTRGEAMKLAQLLSTVNNFKASKGWLDKYLQRAERNFKEDTDYGKYFVLLPCSELKSDQDKKKILTCLKEIGASDEFIKRFEALKSSKDFSVKIENETSDDFDDDKNDLSAKSERQ